MSRTGPWRKFRGNPSSLRFATTASITVIVILVVLGAVVMRVFDSVEYPTFGDALWFTLQTITTVGYGDSTPVTAVGRIVASIVMLVSIGLITVITAIITSLFIQSTARDHEAKSTDDAIAESLDRIEASLAAGEERLDRIERGSAPGPSVSDDAT